MKKQFLFFSMLLMGLFVLSTTARAEMTPEEAKTKAHWARLIAQPSSVTGGSGQVSVNVTEVDVKDAVFHDKDSADTYTETYATTTIGSTDAHFDKIYARANDGCYFAGWSYTDGGTDLTLSENSFDVPPSMEKGYANIRRYNLYAAFNRIRLRPSPEIDGSGEFYQTITVTAEADLDNSKGFNSAADARHFKLPIITKKTGTEGTWDVDVTEWSTEQDNIVLSGGTATLTIHVTFTAPDEQPREYAATLTLETKAGVKLNIHLYARTPEAEAGQAIRYNKAKEKQEQGAVADLLDHAEEDDIIKLIGDYNTAETINKNITLDFNGYNWKQPLTVDGGTLTIAYSPYGGRISNTKKVTVNAGKLIANGGTLTGAMEIKSGAEAVINGAVVNKLVTNNGTLTITDGALAAGVTSAGTLNVNGGKVLNESGTAVAVTAGTASINKGTITGSTYGVEVTGGTANVTIEKLAAISGGTKALNGAAGTLTVNNGKFADPNVLADGTITFNAGFFKTNDGEVTHVYGKPIWNNKAGAEYREGYKLFAGSQETAQASGVSVCRINNTSYATLEAALDYANNNPDKPTVIFMVNDYTLKAGYYTIPKNATLVVPMSDEQDAVNLTVEHTSTSSNYAPYAFRTLTFASGVNMEILGALEVTCVEACKTGEPMQSVPDGPYGHLVLQAGSHITLSAGSELRAWGYVTGEGEIDARRGSIVREQFQIGDWKGGNVSLAMIMEANPQKNMHLFPVYTYFIQNIEAPVKYHPGSALLCAVAVEVSGGIRAYADEIKIVGVQGETAMFLMDQKADAENTWVRKWYDASKDQQVYEVNSGAQLGSIEINLGEIPAALLQPGNPDIWSIIMNSEKFVLPLTSNFKIHLLSGQMEFTQSTACLPGMEVEIDKESTISIVKNEKDGVVDGALYFYDADQWGRYLRGNKFGTIVNYSATVGGKPTKRNISSAAAIGDAKLIVHGTFQMADGCAVYTTAGKKETSEGSNKYVADLTSGGASITSTNEDAGTFIFLADAMPSNELTVTKSGTKLTSIGDADGNITEDVLINYDNYTGEAWEIGTPLGGNADIYNFQLCTSARLKNGEGAEEPFVNTYIDNDHHAVAGDAYCFIDNQWRLLKVDEDNECFLADVADPLNPQYYAKPQEYVAITATKDGEGNFIGNADHTFSDAAGSGRLFILLNDGSCQWWEVENKDNLYHCIHPQNDTYYYWDDVDGEWKEKRFTITWKNWNGTIIQTADEHGNPTDSYSVTYGTKAEFFGTNPTREPSIDYTYDFSGWSPDLAPVTKDVVYTATYIPKERKYTIIFQQEGGMEIERHLLGHNEVPVCENVPVRTGFTLQWTPAIAAVTGDAVYTATWLEEPPTEYEITFVDYDGDLENHTIWKGNVAVGTLPDAPAISDGKPVGAAGKPATSEFSYVFDHWSPNVVLVTQAMTYIAVYREEPVKYTVIFQNEDGSEIERGEYKYGEMPACTATPTKPSTDEWSYTLMWTPEIQTVMGPATYRADFETLKTKNKYTVAAKCSPAGAAVVTGGGVYDYNAAEDAVTIGFSNVAEGFFFTKWSDNITTPARTMPVTGNIELTAIFSNEAPVNYTITWKNEDGSETLQEVTQPAGPTSYTGTTPTKPATSTATYEFDGWTTEPNGAGTYYKNGMTPDATADATYYAHFKEEATSNDLHVEGIVILDEPKEYQDLYISSNGVDASGQLVNAQYLNLSGDAYFDLTLNAQHHTWYAVAVPWQVKIGEGISVNGHVLAATSEIDVVYHDGQTRAEHGPEWKNWHYLQDGDIMYPGIQYMIALSHNAETIRFKMNGTFVESVLTAVEAHPSQTGDSKDRGWNGISNPALFHGYVNPGVDLGQVYVPGEDRYEPFDFSAQKLVVGQGAFVQVDADKDIQVCYNKDYDYNPLAPAPRRIAAAYSDINAKYEVRLSPVNKSYTDRIFVRMNNSKEQDVYTIGKDLSKMGVSAKVPQMWVNRYDTRLCLNTMTPVESSADYPLAIFAPKDGEYTISIKYGAVTDTQSDLYLTLDGKAIWNLSRNAYVLDLEQGTTERYGLRLCAKAPQSAQAIDEILVDSKDETAVKVLFNGQVFIIRGGEVYTITGNKVK